jgi:hypothetical protein
VIRVHHRMQHASKPGRPAALVKYARPAIKLIAIPVDKRQGACASNCENA